MRVLADLGGDGGANLGRGDNVFEVVDVHYRRNGSACRSEEVEHTARLAEFGATFTLLSVNDIVSFPPSTPSPNDDDVREKPDEENRFLIFLW